MKILIVDDEKIARERIMGMIKEIMSEVIIQEAKHGLDAINQLNSYQADIIFLDIRMPVMDGLECANYIMQLPDPPVVIFSTAYQDHALAAFDANAIDYILKPINRERLKIALERASKANIPAAKKLMQSQKIVRNHLSVVSQGYIQLLAIRDIYYFKAEDKYVTAVCAQGDILLTESLRSLEEEFSDRFIRIHRNALVAIGNIDGLQKNRDGHYVLKLKHRQDELIVSRSHVRKIKKMMLRFSG